MEKNNIKSSELGRIKRSLGEDWVVSLYEISNQSKKYLSIREFVNLSDYSGFTRKGIDIKAEDFLKIFPVLELARHLISPNVVTTN